ncbi:uncharacterized protein N7511_009799 [Penicillium nucicola]|uniref:uncharacterized protein n=1 Tax=Penicillium nucicola TaxID=1850975 RepID=UPI002544E2F8|nr:uncharacterized protein N7511_009799 [Penicillium nucicola]KAJ5748103.1 hypothetical protein N7511_009799 [Penicillium nucicola]
MKFSSYLAAAAAITGVTASPHPAPAKQEPLGAQSTLAQPISSQSAEDIINNSPLLSLHRDLVEIESVSGNEHDVGLFVAKFLEARNFTVVKQEVPPLKGHESPKTRYNIYAYPDSHSEPPSILLTSHIDTVPPFIPYSIHRPEADVSASYDSENLILAGRGTVDAKGSVAAQIFATLETLNEQPDAKLGLLFVVGEEVGGDGMKTFSNSEYNTDSAYHTLVFGEPTEANLVSGHKGMLGFEVFAHGSAAHSGYPWLGRSAVSAILPALSRVDKLGSIPTEKGGLPSSPKYGETTLNVGVVRAGVATNVVPAQAYADVSVRLAAGTPDEAREIIKRAVADASRDEEAEVVVDFSSHGESYEPVDLDVDVEGFDVTTVNYGTDVPNLSVRSGVKRYLYGPGSIFVAHGDHEALSVRQLQDAVGGFKKLIQAALDREEQGLAV